MVSLSSFDPETPNTPKIPYRTLFGIFVTSIGLLGLLLWQPLVALIVFAIVAFIQSYRWLLRHCWFESGATLEHEKCGSCAGCGVQWHDGNKWTIIPRHLRDMNKEERSFQPKLANTRRCPSCQGLGRIWGRKLISPEG